MSVLTNHEILRRIERGEIAIDPFDPARLGPNSYDVMVSPEILEVHSWAGHKQMIVMGEPTGASRLPLVRDFSGQYDINGKCVVLQPRRLYLATTVETIGSQPDLVPYLDGRSSIGRLGISVHVTAGRGDRGFRGQWTLEVQVVYPTLVRFDVPWAQITWHTVEGATDGGYQVWICVYIRLDFHRDYDLLKRLHTPGHTPALQNGPRKGV
jgi:dCTP deaminase